MSELAERGPEVDEAELQEQAEKDAVSNKLSSVMDDLVQSAKRGVESWLEAADAACLASGREQVEVLRALAKSRGQAISQDLEKLKSLRGALGSLEARRSSLKHLYKQSLSMREGASVFGVKDAARDVDTVVVRLLECERRRSEIMGEAIRIAQRAEWSAKELYGQVSALTGNGRVRETGPVFGGVTQMKEVGRG